MSDHPARIPPPKDTDRTPVQPSDSVLALIMADQQERWGRGERPFVETYFEKWPMMRADEDKALDLIYHEHLLREQCGEAPDPAEYQARFPQWGEALRLLFEVHQAMPPAGPDLSQEGRPCCVLAVVRGPHRGHRVEVREHTTMLVGRGPLAQLRLADDPHVSKVHLLLEINPPCGYLRDLGSRNGTFVNGEKERVRERCLRHGDVVAVGQTHLCFTVEGAAAAATLGSGSTTAPPAAPAGRTDPPPAPGYEIVRPLDRAGPGAVYLARRQGTGQLVDLRLIVPDPPVSEATMRRLVREVSVLGQLDHPRIVRCDEMGLDGGRLFFAMEHVETVPLEDVLAGRTETDPVRVCCALLCQVLEGLAYAHGRNLVHGDVQPASILVSRSGAEPQARLADFGLARMAAAAGLLGLTHGGQSPETYAFLAPEQVLDARYATPAADVYGAGATLYRLIANRYPHKFGGDKDPLLAVLEDPPEPLRVPCPGVSRALADVVERALARDPRLRFATAAAMRQALLPHAGP
jgi:serine/threonine-protein kinase